MLDLKYIINNSKEVKEGLKNRNFDTEIIDRILSTSERRSFFMTKLQQLENQRNTLSKSLSTKKDIPEEFNKISKIVLEIKKEIEETKTKEVAINSEINNVLLYIPNLPLETTPVGKNESENKVIKEHGKIGKGLIKDVIPHYEIGQKLDLIDFNHSVTLSGSRFWSYKNQGAKLVRSLVDFMISEHTSRGYEEITPPLMVKEEILLGTRHLPKFAEDLFKLENKNMYLISTSEIPLTAWHYDKLLDLTKPKKFTAYTPCFRSEAGSGGRDLKGLIRGHQFYKVELVKITNEEDGYKEFLETIKDAKNILEKLELPFREVSLCTGDLGFSSRETIDLEVWMPSENKYREISSISYCHDFQARGLKIRYKNQEGKNVFATTINGSGLAIDRLVAAILENYQNKDGKVELPKMLKKYFDNQEFLG